jgi:hypothetical protein
VKVYSDLPETPHEVDQGQFEDVLEKIFQAESTTNAVYQLIDASKSGGSS